MSIPRLAVTLGDPVGIGPEVVLKALSDREALPDARWVVVGPAWARGRAHDALGTSWDETGAEFLDVSAPEGTSEPRYGCGGADSGAWAIASLESAAALAETREVAGIVTAPVSKAAIHAAGHRDFVGHTEYFGRRVGVPEPTMFFWGPDFCVSLVTVHCALAEVPGRVTQDRVAATIDRTAEIVGALGTASPRLGVCGVNPHAGEDGLFGKQDRDEILPAVERARAAGICAEGPLPGDTAFMRAGRGEYDAIVAMYHDQGLAPFKLVAFESGVNVTLGLPYVRTSVDHGTAFDIAGTGKADASSMLAALRLAARLTHAPITAR